MNKWTPSPFQSPSGSQASYPPAGSLSPGLADTTVKAKKEEKTRSVPSLLPAGSSPVPAAVGPPDTKDGAGEGSPAHCHPALPRPSSPSLPALPTHGLSPRRAPCTPWSWPHPVHARAPSPCGAPGVPSREAGSSPSTQPAPGQAANQGFPSPGRPRAPPELTGKQQGRSPMLSSHV